MKQTGLTLIELLIAIVIAVTLGVATITLLDSATGVEEQVSDRSRAVTEMDATFRQLSEGFVQTLQQRPVRTRNDIVEPALVLFENELTLVQNGWYQLPNDERPQSAARRLRYSLESPCPLDGEAETENSSPVDILDDTPQPGCIVRQMERHLDHRELDTASYQYLLNDVTAMGITLLTSDGENLNSITQFPPEEFTAEAEAGIQGIVGVEILIAHELLGNIKRTFYVGQGAVEWGAMPEQES